MQLIVYQPHAGSNPVRFAKFGEVMKVKPLVIKFDVGNEVRAIARERVGPAPARRVMMPKTKKKPKYKEVFE